MKTEISRFCAEIGRDPLLVQGAGGNASWKDKDALWVKASGTWLAEAEEKDIFVPVDLSHLRTAITAGDYSVTPRVSAQSGLRPSIETLLHALLPHRVVAHFHAVDVLAWLVRKNVREALSEKIADMTDGVVVDYQKPGPDLAKAVCDVLKRKVKTDILFLKNHGVVIGGNDVQEIRQRLKNLLAKLTQPAPERLPLTAFPAPIKGYMPVSSPVLHHLACDNGLFSRLASEWALYPDHVVFLGSRASYYLTWDECEKKLSGAAFMPDTIIVRSAGVYVTSAFTKAQLAQLRCYFDVLLRQPPGTLLTSLSEEQIASLLDWDAEKYRRQSSVPA